MYASRKMTPAERAEVIAGRKTLKLPWHAPPHFGTEPTVYMLSAACYEHRPLLHDAKRRDEWLNTIMTMESDLGSDLRAWVVLPNHYHLLAQVPLPDFRVWIARRHNGKATQWNREDGTPGRQVWYRFTDRWIRSERHYYAALNYIHGNPVKHGYAQKATEWAWSSVHRYQESVGLDTLKKWWGEYPVGEFGKGWDD